MLDDFKKATGFTGGVKFGGGDTDTDEINQPGFFGRKLTVNAPVAKFTLPKGTVLFAYMILPDEAGVPSAGTVDAGPTGGTADAYIADGPLTAPALTALAAPVRLAVDTEITLTATGLAGGSAYVALQAVVPGIRG